METKSHVLLAKYLLKQIPDFDSAIYQKVFILGCIEPDFNMFSYLKGSLKCQRFRGHNYNSSSNYTAHILEKLQGKRYWGLREYYRLGKLMHYLSDAFTYPHNDNFSGTLWEHRVYEARLHPCFAACLKQCSKENTKDYPEDVRGYIGEFHRQYTRASGDVNNDAKFITQATSRVMRALAYGLTPVCPVCHEQCEVPYENSNYNRLVRTDY
ncbi:MAG: zinc dependent phospholipase C family protein [Lawsonibacter sp.]|jgi:hypothetical protein